MTETPQNKASARKAATSRLAAKRAAKAASKAAKKGTGPIVPDQVAETVGSATSWVDEHQRALWAGIAIVGLGGILWLTIAGHVQKQSHESAELLEKGVAALMAPVVDEGESGPKDVDETFASEQARAEEAANRLAKVSAHHPESVAAAYAELARGNALNALGKHTEAQAAYEKARTHAGGDAYLKWRSLEAIGFSLEAEGKYAEAAKSFAQLEALGPAQANLAQYHRARMLAKQGKQAEARKLLEALLATEKEGEPGEAAAANALPSLTADAELLLASLGGTTEATSTLRADIPHAGPTAEAAGNKDGQLTQQIVDSLRKQLEAQEKAGGAKPGGLTPEIVEELQKKVADGETAGSVMKVPAPGSGPSPETPEAEAKPSGPSPETPEAEAKPTGTASAAPDTGEAEAQ